MLVNPATVPLVLAVKAEVISATVPVRVVPVSVTTPVVLASSAIKAAASTDASVTDMDKALVVPVRPARVVISPSVGVAVMTPVVSEASEFI
jgi:hypothetical protein